jgi:hypothetical protein
MSEIAVVQRNTREEPMGLKHAHQRLSEMVFSGDMSWLLKSSLQESPRNECGIHPRRSHAQRALDATDQGPMHELG